jgi:nitrite reductase/ring-hydroxylating ferredoxin subunit
MRKNKLKYLLFSICVIICLFLACKKQNKNPIPESYVSFYLNISSTLYLNLTSVGGWENITGGYKGIVVYRKSSDEFVAFERACPHDWEIDSAYVSVDPSGLILKCKSCSSEFLILDGSIVQGPSSLPLKQYKTDFDGQTLHVYN